MKVALVSEHASPLAALGGVDAGGQNVHVAALARELAAQGQSVVVHTRRDDPALPRQVQAADILVDHVDAGPPAPVPKDELLGWMGDFAAVLARRWEEDRPDVVHAHFWMSGMASLQAARPLGIPVVQTYHALGAVKRRHQGEADSSPAERLDIERWLLADVEHVIATCADEVSELARLGPAPRGISVIPCGVDLARFRPDGPVMLRGATRRRVAAVGRLVERKGLADAIEALQWLPDTELVVAGGPAPDALDPDPDLRRLRAVACRFGVGQRVNFLGRVSREELPALLRSSDAVVSVPYYEPFGMVPLEAMACGVPPVVSAVGGLRESVVDGVTGLHVPPGDPRTLAGALTRVFDNPALARSLGEAGRQRVRTNYGWAGVASRTIEVYQQVVERAGVADHEEAASLSGVPAR